MSTVFLVLLGMFSLLLADEARQSAISVVEGHYAVMGYVLTVIGIGLLLGGVAKSLLLRQAKESSGLLRVNNK